MAGGVVYRQEIRNNILEKSVKTKMRCTNKYEIKKTEEGSFGPCPLVKLGLKNYVIFHPAATVKSEHVGVHKN